MIYRYVGTLKPKAGIANYSTSGQLSPLLNDPYYQTIGLGTRIFLGGGEGYVTWYGTQHNPHAQRGENGVPLVAAGTLWVMGDLKQMTSEWIVGVSILGYGVSLAVGIGVPCRMISIQSAASPKKVRRSTASARTATTRSYSRPLRLVTFAR